MFPIHFAKLSEPSVNDGILVMIKEHRKNGNTKNYKESNTRSPIFSSHDKLLKRRRKTDICWRICWKIKAENKWPAALLTFFGCRPHDMIQIIILFSFVPRVIHDVISWYTSSQSCTTSFRDSFPLKSPCLSQEVAHCFGSKTQVLIPFYWSMILCHTLEE